MNNVRPSVRIGGGTGIGRAIAVELASLGATVVIASRDEQKCQIAAKEMNEIIKATGSRGTVVTGPSTSIRSEEEIENLVSHTVQYLLTI